MARLRIRVSPKAQRALEWMPADLRVRIRICIQSLSENPRPKGAVQLRGTDDIYRVRVGKYRILYSFTATDLQIEAIGSRGDIYKRFG